MEAAPRISTLKNSDPALTAPAGTDERLLEDYVAGDHRAFSRLFERHGVHVSRFAKRKLGSRHAWAEDVTQDVFVRVAHAARRFEGRSSFRTWLFGITLNVCRDYLRRERHATHDDGALAVIPDVALDPLERLERDERARLIRGALGELVPPYRLILRLRDGEDMTYDEIARTLDVPIGTVRSRLHNARATLAKALADRIDKR